MMKKFVSLLLILCLVLGIACMVYGLTGTAIYETAAAMMGSDKKSAMTYVQDPSKLTELGSIAMVPMARSLPRSLFSA